MHPPWFNSLIFLKPFSVVSFSLGCPSGAFHKPRPNEVIPGDVSDVTVKFVQQTKDNSQGWVAKVNWTAPKGIKDK